MTETREEKRGKGVVEPADEESEVTGAIDAEPVADGPEDTIGQSADDSG